MLGKRMHMLPSATWVAGPMQFSLKDAPALARVKAICFRAELSFLSGAAQAAIVSSQLPRIVGNLDIGGTNRGSGAFWHVLEWHRKGRQVVLPAGIPAANAQTYRRNLVWRVPYHDPRHRWPGDSEYVANHWNQQALTVTGAAPAELDTGDNTWNTLGSVTGLLRCWLELDDPNDSPGAALEFGFNDCTGQAPNLDPGLYLDLFSFRETLATIDSTQVATIGLQADGTQVVDPSFKLHEFLSSYNDAWGAGSDLESSSATVPVGAEELPEEPAATAGAAATVTAPFVPILWPSGPNAKLVGGLLAERNLRVDYTGTDTTLHVGWARVRARDDSQMVAAFRELGRADITSADQCEARTGSKRKLQPWKAGIKRYLPLRALRSRV